MREYYWRWLRTAFSRSIGLVDIGTGIVVALAGILDRFWPEAQIMTSYGWQIPVWALAAVMAVRLVLAPFWMFQEDDASRAKLQLRLENKAARQAALDRLWASYKSGVQLRNRDMSADDVGSWLLEEEEWRTETFAAAEVISPQLRQHLEILNETHPPPLNVNIVSPKHGAHVRVFSEVLRRMQEYLGSQV
jgi:hypothetical protein